MINKLRPRETGWRAPQAKAVTFEVGNIVKKAGSYICVPCGYKKYFKEGDRFPRCFSCVKKEKYKDDNFFKDLGLWELKD